MRDTSFFQGSNLLSARAYTHSGHMGMRAVADPAYGLVSVFMTSAVTTPPGVAAAAWPVGQLSQTIGTMAAAVIQDL